MLLPMLMRNPKLLIIGVVILGAVYFMGGMDGCGGAIPGDPGGGGGGISDIVSNLFNKGATLDPAEYETVAFPGALLYVPKPSSG